MKYKFLLVLKFYATVLVPIIYGINLWLIGSNGGEVSLAIGLRVVGIVLAVMGIGMWVLSYLSLRGSFGVLPRKQKRVKRGIYGLMKHPMYVGISLTFGGLAIANESILGLVFLFCVLGPMLWVRGILEEKVLS